MNNNKIIKFFKIIITQLNWLNWLKLNLTQELKLNTTELAEKCQLFVKW